MSSHHVVREAQEPALLILQASALKHSHLAPLLEWSPTIVVTAKALPQVLEQGIKVDAVLCPESQQDEISTLVQEQEPISLVSLKEKENTLTTALIFLTQHKHTAVNILTSGNFPTEQEEIKGQLLAQSTSLNVVLLDEYYKSVLYRSGKFIKWFPPGETIRFQPTQRKMLVSCHGFTSTLEQAPLQENVDLKTAGAGMVTISGSAPFWIHEKIN